jgi:hypothetical protein
MVEISFDTQRSRLRRVNTEILYFINLVVRRISLHEIHLTNSMEYSTELTRLLCRQIIYYNRIFTFLPSSLRLHNKIDATMKGLDEANKEALARELEAMLLIAAMVEYNKIGSFCCP